MNHSKEPWKFEPEGVYQIKAIRNADGNYLNSDADGERIVACVNFCEGLTDDEIRTAGNAQNLILERRIAINAGKKEYEELYTLRKELAEAKERNGTLKVLNNHLECDLRAAEERIKELEAFKKWFTEHKFSARHSSRCAIRHDNQPCTCGLSTLLSTKE